MLVKVSLGNVEILNRAEIIEQLQKGNDKIVLVLKPTWYGQYASIGGLWSVPGSTMKELEANEGIQNYQIYLDGNGRFSIDQEFDEVPDDPEE